MSSASNREPRFDVSPLLPADVHQIRTWHYPEPYALYNMTGLDMAEDLDYFLAPANHFHRVVDAAGMLIGFCSFGEDAQVPGGDYSLDALDVGVGMHPARIGQGLGAPFLRAILAYAQRQFAPQYFRATVAHFNHRSRRMFQRQGFIIVQTFHSQGKPTYVFDVLLRRVEDDPAS